MKKGKLDRVAKATPGLSKSMEIKDRKNYIFFIIENKLLIIKFSFSNAAMQYCTVWSSFFFMKAR